MASERERRKSGAGGAIAGILEQPAPPETVEEANDLVEGAIVEEPTAKGTKKRKLSRVSSKRKGITGRTFYLPDDLYGRIVAKAIGRKETASEFAAWVFEGHFGLRKRTPGDASDAA
jgi:hypothetical protein